NLHARQGALCLIGGESGIGKTRLALECVQQAMRDRKADVYIGACAPIGSRRTGGALHPMRTVLEAISDRLREDGERQTLDILGKDVRLLSQFEPSLATLPTVSEMDEPVSLPAREAEMRVYVALQRVFERLSRLRPILLVLDDLQWADDLTMGWLRFLVRSRFDQRCRLLILGIFRREEKTIELDRLMQMERVDNLFLERLDRQAVGEVVRTMLAMPRAPDEFVDFLHRESEGNPFFVAEYLRTAVTEGMLTRDRSGKWRLVQAALDDLALESLELPRALKQLIERRIDALDVEARRAAEFAAVLGRQFSPDLLAEGLSATDLSGVDQLVERDVLDFDDDGRLFFAHEKIREVTYAQIPAPRRAELHRLAAECLTRRDMRGQYLAQRAHHWEFAGEVGLARSCYYDSAASATSRFEFGEAKQLFHAYLNLVSQADGESIGCRQQLGRLLLESGETHAAEVQATIAFDEASALDLTVEQGRSYVLLAEINRVRGDVDSALWQLQMASEAFADPSCEVEECHRLMLLARIRADLSESDAAEQANTAALILSRRHEMRKDEGQILNNLATIHFLRGEFDSGRSEITEALEIHRAEGDRLAEGLALGILGTSYQEQGHFDRAIALREEALRIHRELGQRGMEGHALAALGHLYLEQGDSERALLFFAQALDIHREVGNRRYEGTTITGLATLLMENGEFEQSEKRYEEALALHHEVGHKSFQAATLINLGCLRRRLGWLDECDEALMSASIILDEIDDPYGSALHQCQLGHLRLARGDSAQEQHERASEIATRLHTTPQSELGRAVDALGEALSASEKGEVLYRGESLRHLAPAVQHGLATRGLLTTR
ncbi:MAG: tetratricopeptide repeat protein, partial [Myxococcales bacterium]|nr:tetratricopeptide repeat protein [Myxococcales bacterium]